VLHFTPTTQLPALLLPLTLGAAPAQELAFRPEEGLTLEKHISVVWSTELESSRTRVGDDERDTLSSRELTSERFELVVRDRYLELEAGVPTRTLRTFVELSGLYDYAYDELAEGGEEYALRLHHQSPIEGETQSLLFHADVGDWERRPFEQGNAALLRASWTGSEEDLDFRFLLPPGAVEPEDSWELDPARLARFALLLEHELAFRPVFEHEDAGLLPLTEEQGEADASQDAHEVVGSARASFAGEREVDGRRCAALALEVELVVGQGWSQTDEEGDVFESASSRRIALEGEALWDLDGGHLHSLVLDGALEVDDFFALEAGQGEARRRTEAREHSPGELHFAVTTTRRAP